MAESELVFVPFESTGHLVPMVELAKALLRRDPLLSISVLLMKPSLDFGADTYLHSLSPFPRLRFVDLRHYSDPGDTPNPNPSVINPERFVFDFIESHKPHVRRFVEAEESRRLAGFVFDMFCTCLMECANEFSVPSYVFFASSFGFLGLSFHFLSLREESAEDIQARYEDSGEELSVPCFATPVPARVLPPAAYQNTAVSDLFFRGVKRFKEAEGIMVNSFSELEEYAFRALSGNDSLPPVYPVGPLLNLDGSSGGHGRNDPSEAASILGWLDAQPQSSVVFLCFGSFGSFQGRLQVAEIATALERSGHRFLWSLRKPPPKGKIELPASYEDPAEVLPEGFLERTESLGRVIGWAPQLAVLSHPSVGAFVSHCGWNSILESIWCGVPVAAWPLYAEQKMNAFELIKELGMAAEVRMDYHKKGGLEGKEEDDVVTAEEILKGIMEAMSDDQKKSGELLRRKVREMKEASRRAVMEGGSSYEALAKVINAIHIHPS